MCAMFGLGRHPSDRANIRRIPRDGASHRVQDAATKLGHAYHFYEQSEFHAALAARYPRAQFRSQCPRRRGYPGHRAGRTEGFDLVRATQDLSGFGLPGTPLLGLRPRFVLRVPRRERRLLRQLDRRRWATVLVLEAPGQGCEFRLDVAPARQPGAQQLGWESGDLADLAPAVARVGTLGEPHPDPFGQQGLDAGVVVLGSGVSTWRRRRCRVGCRRRASPAMRSCRLQPAACSKSKPGLFPQAPRAKISADGAGVVSQAGLPRKRRPDPAGEDGRDVFAGTQEPKVLVRSDSAGATHTFAKAADDRACRVPCRNQPVGPP